MTVVTQKKHLQDGRSQSGWDGEGDSNSDEQEAEEGSHEAEVKGGERFTAPGTIEPGRGRTSGERGISFANTTFPSRRDEKKARGCTGSTWFALTVHSEPPTRGGTGLGTLRDRLRWGSRP
jgi:hypothetical protein